jgi:hypothetical protein
MEASWLSETLASYITTRRHKTEDHDFHFLYRHLQNLIVQASVKISKDIQGLNCNYLKRYSSYGSRNASITRINLFQQEVCEF